MKTILYLNNHYCESLSDIKIAFKQAFEKRQDHPRYDTEMKHIESLYKDGILTQWLLEGDEECLQYGNLLKQIPKQNSTLGLYKELAKIFIDKNVEVIRRLNDYAKFVKAECIIGNTIYPVDNVVHPKEVRYNSAKFVFQFEIIKPDSEVFTFSLKTENKMMKSKSVNVGEYNKGDIVVIDFSDDFSLDTKIDTFKYILSVDNHLLRSFELKRPGMVKEFNLGFAKFTMIKVLKSNESFYIGETPVTQGLWYAVTNRRPSYHGQGNPELWADLPVEQVSWDDCQMFIYKLNQLLKSSLDGLEFRLPTSEEWMFAAKGGHLGTSENHLGGCWYNYNSGNRTHKVKEKIGNALGIFDMRGNVLEWCDDWSPYNKTKICHGGSYNYSLENCSVETIFSFQTNYINRGLGLRLVMK